MRAWVIGGLMMVGTVTAAVAQPPPGPRGRGAVNEVSRLFEAYAVVQAQETLALDEAQYAKFLPRFRSLLRVRRSHEVARAQILVDLGRLARPDARRVDENAVRDRLDALEEELTRGRAEVDRATAEVDEVLTLPQRARFRVFEEQMERKKFELMTRARQSVRQMQRRVP